MILVLMSCTLKFSEIRTVVPHRTLLVFLLSVEAQGERQSIVMDHFSSWQKVKLGCTDVLFNSGANVFMTSLTNYFWLEERLRVHLNHLRLKKNQKCCNYPNPKYYKARNSFKSILNKLGQKHIQLGHSNNVCSVLQ